jgi:DNA-binding GntR family transcriptional regulator
MRRLSRAARRDTMQGVMSAPAPASESTSASARAYRHVKEQVLDGTLPGGELVTEGEVAQALGMSRTPVRAAFTQLEAEGLLRLYPKRGALVVPVSAEEVEAVIETRWVIERHAIAVAMERPGELSAALADLVAEQERLAALGDDRPFVDSDRAFHRAIVAAAGNPILLTLYDSLRDRQRRMGLTAAAREPARTRRIAGQHRELAEAIAGRDAPLAEQRLRAHLEDALVVLRPAAGRLRG